MPILLLLTVSVVSFFGTVITLHVIMPLLANVGLTGRDLHKKNKPEIPEMGGLGILVGVTGGIVIAIGAEAFLNIGTNTVPLFAVLSTVLIVSIIGVFDDLLNISQLVKSITPLFAALPLMAIRVGVTTLKIPFDGSLELGILYPLLLVPIGVTGAANAVNMLAGFNGLELGVGLIAFISLTLVAIITSSPVALLILIVGLGAIIGAFWFNWCPAKILVGDVGTLTIGAIMASAVIIGNFELAGIVIIVPYFLDFLLKALAGFPTHGWEGELDKKGNLHCPKDVRPISLPQVIMRVTGGVSECGLSMIIMGLEAIAGTFAVLLYLIW